MPRRVLHSRRTTKQLLCKFYPKVFMVQLSSWLGRDSVQYVRIDNCIVKEMEKEKKTCDGQIRNRIVAGRPYPHPPYTYCTSQS